MGGQAAGHVMQIFVHKDVVDTVAHGAVPYGELAPNGWPVSSWLSRMKSIDGQARIFLHPAVFLSDRVHLFTYSGAVTYGAVQRRLVLEEIHEVLDRIFDDAALCASARKALRMETAPPRPHSLKPAT